MPHHADDRDAERVREPLAIDLPAARAQLVHHREHETDGHAEPQHLRHEQQRALDRAGIHREHDAVGRRHLGDLAAEHARDHCFVRRERRQAVDTGQIDHAQAGAVHQRIALAALDRNPGIISDARAQAGECVEERGLA